jgi:hypothetical protein
VTSKPPRKNAQRQALEDDELLPILKQDEETKEIIRKTIHGSIAWRDCLHLVMARIGEISTRETILISTVDTLVRALVFPPNPSLDQVPKYKIPPSLARTNPRRYRKLVEQLRNDADLESLRQKVHAGAADVLDYIQKAHQKYPELRGTVHLGDFVSALVDISESDSASPPS